MVQKFDSACFQDALHYLDVLRSACDRTGARGFHASDRVDVHAGKIGDFLLLDPNESASGFQLISGGKHVALRMSFLVTIPRNKLTMPKCFSRLSDIVNQFR